MTENEPVDTKTVCGSTFVAPDSGQRYYCEGAPDHAGMQHGGQGASWGDKAAEEHHPGEQVVVRTSQLIEAIQLLRLWRDRAMRTLMAVADTELEAQELVYKLRQHMTGPHAAEAVALAEGW